MWYLDNTIAEYNRCKSARGKIIDRWCAGIAGKECDGESTWVVTRGRAVRYDGNGASYGAVRGARTLAIMGAQYMSSWAGVYDAEESKGQECDRVWCCDERSQRRGNACNGQPCCG